MEATISQNREKMFKRYVRSDRHTMQVDYDVYLHALGKDEKAGRKRARKAGNRLPVTPKAHERQTVVRAKPAPVAPEVSEASKAQIQA